MANKDFKVGDWIVRPDRLCIVLPEKTVHVTPKSMAVLQQLAAAKGEVVARNDILDEVWPGAAVTDDVLTQCIVELRKAFDDSAHEPKFIETVPRKGIRLVAPVSSVDVRPADRRPLLIAIAAILAVVIVGAVYFYQARVVSPDTPKTIAVLPFADLSPEGDQGFFTNGLTEELIHRLDMLDGLDVTGRASSFALKDRGDDLQAIGEQLGVSYLLDGSVRQVDGESRVTAKLTQVQSGLIKWSDVYAAEFEDLFTVQDRIAEAVATALSIELQVGDLAETDGGTNDIHAYQEYLLARAELVALESDPFKIVQHYERATELDPDYALAWASLAEACHAATWGWTRDEPYQLAERRDTAISKAVSLAPRSAEVLKIKAQLDIWQYKFRDARLVLERLHSGDAGRGIRYSMVDLDLFLKTGRIRDAFFAIKAIKRRDPLNPFLQMSESQLFFITGRTDDALAVREQLFHAGRGGAYLANVTVPVALSSGRREEIEKWLRRADDIDRPRNLGYRTIWRALLEDLDDRDAMLETLRRQQSRGVFDNFIPVLAAWLGEEEMALESMRRVPDPWFMWAPLLKPVRETKEFKQIVIDNGLVDYWRDFGWGDFCTPTEGDDFECH